MHITEVRIKLTEDTQERLLAFCSMTLDGCFVVRDLKIIQGGKGPFVAMPSGFGLSEITVCGTAVTVTVLGLLAWNPLFTIN